MWAAILALAAPLINLISKFIPGNQPETVGDQKAADEQVTVDAFKRVDKAAAQPSDTKKDLNSGNF